MKTALEKDYNDLANVFLNAFLMGMGFLTIWVLGWVLGRDWVFDRHSRYFKIPSKQFDAIHYTGMAAMKTLLLLLFFVPYLALKAAGGCCCCRPAGSANALPAAKGRSGKIPATRGLLDSHPR
jgi:hypothetical protein